jgi:tRNA A37 threonylcarbamoyladenosine synthetase subunit TsaC/SUA5/YrdC
VIRLKPISDIEIATAADQAFKIIAQGGLVVAPHDVGYGLVGHSRASVERLFAAKGRLADNPCVVPANIPTLRNISAVADPELLTWVAHVSDTTPLGVVVPMNHRSDHIRALDPSVRDKASKGGTMAVFLNSGGLIGPLADRACSSGMLLVASSANLSGSGNSYSIADVAESILDEVDIAFDNGPARLSNPAGLATTIVDLDPPAIVRVGVNCDEIERSYRTFAAHRANLPAALHRPGATFG